MKEKSLDEDFEYEIRELGNPKNVDAMHLLDAVTMKSTILAQVPVKYRVSVETFLNQPLTTPKDHHPEFKNFSCRETMASGRPAADLVEPSGCLAASLGLKLHYPTFAGQASPEQRLLGLH